MSVTHEELGQKLDAISAELADVRADVSATKEIVEAWAAVKTAGRFVKWLSGIIGALGVIWLVAKAAAMNLLGRL